MNISTFSDTSVDVPVVAHSGRKILRNSSALHHTMLQHYHVKDDMMMLGILDKMLAVHIGLWLDTFESVVH